VIKSGNSISTKKHNVQDMAQTAQQNADVTQKLVEQSRTTLTAERKNMQKPRITASVSVTVFRFQQLHSYAAKTINLATEG